MFCIKMQPGFTINRCVCCLQLFYAEEHSMPEMFNLMASCFSINVSMDLSGKRIYICPSCVQRLMVAHRLKNLILGSLPKLYPPRPNEDDFSSPYADNMIGDADCGVSKNVQRHNGPTKSEAFRESSKDLKDVRVNLMKMEHLYPNNIDLIMRNQCISMKSDELSLIASKEAANLASAFGRRKRYSDGLSVPFVFEKKQDYGLYSAYLALPKRPDAFAVVRTVEVKPYECAICSKTYSSRTYLRKHVKVHGPRPFECTVCTKAFTTGYDLRVHMKSHSQVREFQCARCPKVFRGKGSLMEHMKNHGLIGSFKCDFCPKAYIARCYLNKHRCPGKKAFYAKSNGNGGNSDTPDGKSDPEGRAEVLEFRCAICSAEFTGRLELSDHMNDHKYAKNFRCSVCPWRFSTKAGLESHMNRHSDARNYKCAECPMTFKYNQALSQHRKQHRDPSVKCHLCPKMFIRKSQLDSHMRNHR